MVRTQISFDESLYREAKKAAKQRGVSLAELCRLGLRTVLSAASKEHRWDSYLGVFESTDPRTSESIDEVVYGREKP